MYQYNLLSRSITHLPGLKQLQMLDKQHDKGILIMNFVGQKPYCKVQGHALHNILTRGGGTPIETLYGDVPPKWVGF